MNRHLYRSRDDRMLAGVAGGLADLWDADPSVIRIAWAFLVILTGGIALVAYIVMALVVPEEDDVAPWTTPPATVGSDATATTPVGAPPVGAPLVGASQAAPAWQQSRSEGREAARAARREARAARRAARGHDHTGGIIIGLLLVLLGAWFLVREYLPSLDWDWFWPLVLVGLGVVVLMLAIRPRTGGSNQGGTFGAGGTGS